jgi:hypothetical protein
VVGLIADLGGMVSAAVSFANKLSPFLSADAAQTLSDVEKWLGLAALVFGGIAAGAAVRHAVNFKRAVKDGAIRLHQTFRAAAVDAFKPVIDPQVIAKLVSTAAASLLPGRTFPAELALRIANEAMPLEYLKAAREWRVEVFMMAQSMEATGSPGDKLLRGVVQRWPRNAITKPKQSIFLPRFSDDAKAAVNRADVLVKRAERADATGGKPRGTDDEVELDQF